MLECICSLQEKRKNYDEQVGICADLARTIAEKEAEQHDLMMRNIQTSLGLEDIIVLVF